jgi:hypothetical protein
MSLLPACTAFEPDTARPRREADLPAVNAARCVALVEPHAERVGARDPGRGDEAREISVIAKHDLRLGDALRAPDDLVLGGGGTGH